MTGLSSTHVTELTQILDFGLQPPGFRTPSLWIPDSDPLDSGLRPSGFWTPSLWIPDSYPLDSGFYSCIPDSKINLNHWISACLKVFKSIVFEVVFHPYK